MGYRGRLIWIFTAEVLRLDTAATAENGPGAVGYDHDFREPLKAADGTTSRVYHPAVELDCQVETEGDPFDALTMKATGDDPTAEVKLVFHFRDLEDHGLVDATTGRALIQKGDKLGRIFDADGMPVGDSSLDLVVTEAVPRSLGLSGRAQNLLLVSFRRRARSGSEA